MAIKQNMSINEMEAALDMLLSDENKRKIIENLAKMSKKSFLDKVIEFFRISSFKSNFDENKVAVNVKQKEVEGKNKSCNT